MADILEFLRAGVDTVMGQIQYGCLADAIREAQDRTGVRAVIVSTPGFNVGPATPAEGFRDGGAERILDRERELGATFCMPHPIDDGCAGGPLHATDSADG